MKSMVFGSNSSSKVANDFAPSCFVAEKSNTVFFSDIALAMSFLFFVLSGLNICLIISIIILLAVISLGRGKKAA